jgi:hypothetical protein
VATAIYPLTVFTATTFYPETLATALLCAAVLYAVEADRALHADAARAKKMLAVAGLLFAALFLSVPHFALAAAVTFAWFAWRHRRAAVPALALSLGLFLAPIVVWTSYNAVQLKAFVPATTGSGLNLLLGNSENTTYGSGVNADIRRYTDVANEHNLDEVESDRYYRTQALEYITSHPGDSLRIWVGKTLNYFAASNSLSTPGESSQARDLLAAAAYYPLLALLLARLALSRKLPLSGPEGLLIALYLLAAPIMAIFVTRVRYRVPLDELLLILLAVAAARWLQARHAIKHPGPASSSGGARRRPPRSSSAPLTAR